MAYFNSYSTVLAAFLLTLIFLLLFEFRKYRPAKYKGRIAFIEVVNVSIYDDFIQAFNSLSVRYKDDSINHNLIYTKGYLANIGNVDISKAMIDSPIEIITYEDNKWEAIEIKSGPTSAKSRVENNNALIELLLLKQNEAIEVDALLIRNDKKNKFIKDIKYRISDIEPGYLHIQYNQDNLQEVKSTYRAYFWIQLACQLLIAIFFGAYLSASSINTLSFLNNQNKSSYTISSEYNSGPKASIKNLNSDNIEKVTLDSLNNRNYFTPKIVEINKTANYFWLLYAESLFLPIQILTLINYIRKSLFAKKIKSIVEPSKRLIIE